MPDPTELSSDKKNLMIFDDFQLEKQDKCETYYIRGIHSNVDCFYLAQSYFKLPRQRECQFYMFVSAGSKTFHHIYDDHVSMDMSKEDFKKLCKTARNQPHEFIVIELTSYKDDGKYRLINNKLDTSMLEKIVLNTKPKEAFYLLLSERSTQIATKFR